MSRIDLDRYADDDGMWNPGRRRQKFFNGSRLHRAGAQRRSDHAVSDEIIRYTRGQELPGDTFAPSLSASYHEREWILTYLGGFYDAQKITDVLQRVKGGKEANVYCCRAHSDTGLDLIAAKIYRPSMFRNLRNDARYRQNRELLDARGKVVRDRRALVATRQNTSTGKEMRHISWLEHEYQTLCLLHDAGADVPAPVASGSNTILMSYIGEVGMPAPALNEIHLPRAEAAQIFERLLWNVELMLQHQRIHGDLSAYNVLYFDGEFKIIDFPQAVDPRANPEAFDIFARDVTRLCEYFQHQGVPSNPRQLARQIWSRSGPRLDADLLQGDADALSF